MATCESASWRRRQPCAFHARLRYRWWQHGPRRSLAGARGGSSGRPGCPAVSTASKHDMA